MGLSPAPSDAREALVRACGRGLAKRVCVAGRAAAAELFLAAQVRAVQVLSRCAGMSAARARLKCAEAFNRWPPVEAPPRLPPLQSKAEAGNGPPTPPAAATIAGVPV